MLKNRLLFRSSARQPEKQRKRYRSIIVIFFVLIFNYLENLEKRVRLMRCWQLKLPYHSGHDGGKNRKFSLTEIAVFQEKKKTKKTWLLSTANGFFAKNRICFFFYYLFRRNSITKIATVMIIFVFFFFFVVVFLW